MQDPRCCTDLAVLRALDVWDRSHTPSRKSFDDAQRLHAELLPSAHHRALGWTALTCARWMTTTGDLDSADEFLIEAKGRLHFAEDSYGQALVDSHIAATLVQRGDVDRAIKFASAPLQSLAPFTDLDRAILHNAAAMSYFRRDEIHLALAHIFHEFELVKKAGRRDKQSTVLANIGAVLLEIGELELSVLTSQEAWALQNHAADHAPEIPVSTLTNFMIGNLYLGKMAETAKLASTLCGHLDKSDNPANWVCYLCLVDAFGALGEAKRACHSIERARLLATGLHSSFVQVQFKIAEASIFEANRNYAAATEAAITVLDQDWTILGPAGKIGAALICSRSFEALGRGSEARKWREIARTTGKKGLLGQILATQLRASLSPNHMRPELTEQELNCLNLSAHGQSSSDIGLKLGIKPRTVNFHFSKILRKLNAMNRQEAIAKAMSANLLKQL